MKYPIISLQQHPGLYVGPSEIHGRGVFCASEIKSGDLIEVAPVVVLPKSELEELKASKLYQYYFLWKDQPAIVMGYGSIYNHGQDPNSTFEPIFERREMIFTALKDIHVGVEILIDYHEGSPRKALWF